MLIQQMTSKERSLAAMAGILPDRVPVQLGVTNMFAVFQQNLRGWDVYADNKVPQWKVSLDTQLKFGLDVSIYANLPAKPSPHDPKTTTLDISRTDDRIIRRTTIQTPEGDLYYDQTIFIDETPSITTGLFKTEKDFDIWLKYCVRDDIEYDRTCTDEIRSCLGDKGILSGDIHLPGLADLASWFEGKLASATYFLYDHPEKIEAYREKLEKAMLRKLEFTIDSGVDYILIAQSGMLTLATPELVRSLCLPTIKKMTRMCKEAGILSELHCCGKENQVIDLMYHETDLDSINPLQPPPMGDCNLAELKLKYGDELCLKGNVGVTNPLLFGTPDDVERDVQRCMDSAKAGGRFILFSEEGIGARTPDVNVRRYVEAGIALGKY